MNKGTGKTAFKDALKAVKRKYHRFEELNPEKIEHVTIVYSRYTTKKNCYNKMMEPCNDNEEEIEKLKTTKKYKKYEKEFNLISQLQINLANDSSTKRKEVEEYDDRISRERENKKKKNQLAIQRLDEGLKEDREIISRLANNMEQDSKKQEVQNRELIDLQKQTSIAFCSFLREFSNKFFQF